VPRVVDHDQRRQQLLERCFELFARQGYAGLTMRRIARNLGTSTGTLYHYFDGKADLFAQMFRWIRGRDIRALAASVPDDVAPAERLELLEAFVVENAQVMSQALRIALEFHREADTPADRALLHETLDDYRGALEEQLGLDDPAAGATILSFILGILTHHILDPDRVDVADQVKLVERVLVRP
jgi:AcrR family transcriptional regulator